MGREHQKTIKFGGLNYFTESTICCVYAEIKEFKLKTGRHAGRRTGRRTSPRLGPRVGACEAGRTWRRPGADPARGEQT
ncbi:hypothetical protein SKAU_G00074500 [Synaphobranchus kaupii]|uniref:Uncharacterized protein n=1 Tax=Synaphobranchus kaupii TaxID=118154 RepID=A0A9Q1G7K8_SYNKA|nr:hypothetical protein SKAU_G00074500 [Synaphobranchus kaupii]